MPVAIDEVTAEVEPLRPEPATRGTGSAPEGSPEVQLRRQCDMHARLECRAARVRAD
jgi:hypothetical protein